MDQGGKASGVDDECGTIATRDLPDLVAHLGFEVIGLDAGGVDGVCSAERLCEIKTLLNPVDGNDGPALVDGCRLSRHEYTGRHEEEIDKP